MAGKDYIDMAISQLNHTNDEAKKSIDLIGDQVAKSAFDIIQEELANSNNPYEVKMYKDGKKYTIVPTSQDKAFEVHIGGPFTKDGDSTTKNEPDQVITRATQKIRQFLKTSERETGATFEVNYTIGNPTT